MVLVYSLGFADWLSLLTRTVIFYVFDKWSVLKDWGLQQGYLIFIFLHIICLQIMHVYAYIYIYCTLYKWRIRQAWSEGNGGTLSIRCCKRYLPTYLPNLTLPYLSFPYLTLPYLTSPTYLPAFFSIYLFIYLSIYLPTFLFYLSIYLSFFLSIYLSI